MAVIVLKENIAKEDVDKAREDYRDYIKITVDLTQKIVALGGEYHADAEGILLKEYSSKQNDIWGGGYNINLDKFETNAIINIRQPINDSTEIINPEIRQKFLELVSFRLKDIRSLLWIISQTV